MEYISILRFGKLVAFVEGRFLRITSRFIKYYYSGNTVYLKKHALKCIHPFSSCSKIFFPRCSTAVTIKVKQVCLKNTCPIPPYLLCVVDSL